MKKEVEVKDPIYKQIPIKGLTGYRISKKGVIINPKGKVLKQRVHSTVKYLCLSIKGKSYYTHELVALAYLGPRPKDMKVLHGKGKKPYLENLSYGTQSKNMIQWQLQRRKNK
jgi:hypothetical protein